MQNVKKRLVAELAKECKSMDDIHNMLKNLFKDTIQKVLEAEMDDHLGYVKHDPSGDCSGNSRNGYSQKTLQTQMGKTEIKIPRDRNGEFEPQIIKKYETTANEVDSAISSRTLQDARVAPQHCPILPAGKSH